MVEREILAAKAATIDRCLERIVGVRKRKELERLDAEEIVLLNLQRAIQAALDMAQHVVTTERYGLPDSLGATFDLLAEREIVTAELARRLKGMAGFRNVLVHQYKELDPRILETVVSDHLDDLRQFVKRILTTFAS